MFDYDCLYRQVSAQWQIFDPLFLDIMAGKASSAKRQVLWKFCSVKMNNSPFCLTAGLLKVLMTDLLCPLLLGPH